MAFKTFTSAVLTASEVNDYLMKQANIVCTSATRPTAVEGMRIYETDTDRELVYDGSNWIIQSEPATTWTPTWTNVTVGNGTHSSWYHRSDGYVDFHASLTFGSTSAVTGSIQLTLPINAVTGVTTINAYGVFYDSSAANSYPVLFAPASTTTLTLNASTASGTYTNVTVTSSTIPFTWATGDIISVSGRYRMTTRAS